MSSFMVNLGDIYFGSRQRKQYHSIPDLAKSLQEQGQIHNIVVRRPNQDEDTEGKNWVLVVGGRRYTAAASVGMDELRAEELRELPEWQQQLIELEENIKRSGINYAEEVEAKARIHKLYEQQAKLAGKEWSQKDTANKIGERPANVSRDLKLHRAMQLDPTLKNATSKKAAVRAVEMKEHTTRVLHLMSSTSPAQTADLKSRLRCMDARDFVKEQPAQSVDLCFTDFPFGLEAAAGGRGYNEGRSEFDDSRGSALQLLRDVVPGMLQMMKPTGWLALVMNWELHFELRSLIENYCLEHHSYTDLAGIPWARPGRTVCTAVAYGAKGDCHFLKCEDVPWLWYRSISQNNPEWPELHAQNQYELILICNMGHAKLTTSVEGRVGNVISCEAAYKVRHHSMQKPPGLCQEIVRRLSLSGGLVVDLCFGSGSALRAAAQLGRRFSGCELNPSMVELALGYVGEVWQGSKGAPATVAGVSSEQLADDGSVTDRTESDAGDAGAEQADDEYELGSYAAGAGDPGFESDE